MIVDRSGSIERTDFELVKAFIVDLILDTNIDTGEARVGLLAYSDDVDVVFQVSSAQFAFCVRTQKVRCKTTPRDWFCTCISTAAVVAFR